MCKKFSRNFFQPNPNTVSTTDDYRYKANLVQQHHVGTVLGLLTLKVVVTLIIQLVLRTTAGTKRTYRPI